VQLNGNCVFWGGGTSLLLSNVVSGTGGLIKNGTYTLLLAAANSYTGNTTVNAGILLLTNNGSITSSVLITLAAGGTLDATGRGDDTLALSGGQTLAGAGIVKGNLNVGSGTVSPGPSLVTLTVTNGAVNLQPSSTMVMEVNRVGSPTSDQLRGDTSIAYGGTLVISNLGPMLVAGDSFKLFTATNYSGSFSSIVPAQPGLGLRWDTNQLNTPGIISGGTLNIALLPQPGVTNAFISSGNITIAGTNGTAGFSYRVLGSTDVAAPISNWTILKTNLFDAGGNFQFTSGTTNLQQFFRIQAL